MAEINKYLANLKRIEFLITYDCTGKCIHCSEGDHKFSGIHINGESGANALKEILKIHNIESVMTFGGEPLMYHSEVYKIHSAANSLNIPHRQLITNGYFSKNNEEIKTVCKNLKKAGVNDILLSVDSFHQETISLEPVKFFAQTLKDLGMPIRTNPAWIKNKDFECLYNLKTKEILKEFEKLCITEGSGNIVFPWGNAKKNLSRYFTDSENYINPYEENPAELKSVSIEPDGTFLNGNIYTGNILKIMDEYTPFNDK